MGMRFVSFDYETNDGKIIEIDGNTDGKTIYFKARTLEGKQVKKSSLSSYDIRNIEELIETTAWDFEELSDVDYFGET